MGKFNSKIIILIILSLCFTGLIFSVYYFLPKNPKNEEIRTHFSNPRDLEFFETAFKFKKNELDLSKNDVVAGVIPHHLLAADLIAEFFENLKGKSYDTVILMGPNHFNAGEAKMITSAYDWQTPYGRLEVDDEILDKISKDVKINEEAITNEHSMTSEVAFIKKAFPQAKFLPIILKPSATPAEAGDLARELFDLSRNKKTLLLASVDFSHYKNSETAQKNDAESVEAILSFDFDKIYNLDIDSPASIYALLKFSQLSTAGFKLLYNSNSAILAGKPDLKSTTSYVTGYFTK
jgi:AmmeMemoRadiSam system protein B